MKREEAHDGGGGGGGGESAELHAPSPREQESH